MQINGKDLSTKIVIGVLASSVLGIGGYLVMGSASKVANHNDVVVSGDGKGNASSKEESKKEESHNEHAKEPVKDDKKMVDQADKKDSAQEVKKEAVKDVPPCEGTDKAPITFSDDQKKEIAEIVLSYIRDNNAAFMTAIQEGAKRQQEKAEAETLKTVMLIKDDLIKNSITIGEDTAAMKVIAFIDPACPHCHEMIKSSVAAIAKTKDLQVHFIIAALIDPSSSEMLARALYAARSQGADKAKTFMIKSLDLPRGASKAQIVLAAKDSGLDTTKFEAERATDANKAIVDMNNVFVHKLNIPGFPMVYFQEKTGELILGNASSADDLVALSGRVKMGLSLKHDPAQEAAQTAATAAAGAGPEPIPTPVPSAETEPAVPASAPVSAEHPPVAPTTMPTHVESKVAEPAPVAPIEEAHPKAEEKVTAAPDVKAAPVAATLSVAPVKPEVTKQEAAPVKVAVDHKKKNLKKKKNAAVQAAAAQ